jgi:DNA-binding beta-propeller fold protein YncE
MLRFGFRAFVSTLALAAGPALVPIGTALADSGYVYTTLAGVAGTVVSSAEGAGSVAQFSAPRGVAVDSAGNLYVADSTNHTVRKITAQGVVSTLAGTAGSSGRSDGVGGRTLQ